MKKYVYIDFENRGDIKSLPEIDGKYFLFIGNLQRRISVQIALDVQKNGERFVKVSGGGKNALDFLIAFQLGLAVEGEKAASDEEKPLYYIVSRDTGYDPLVSHINATLGEERAFRIDSPDCLNERS